MSLADSKQAPYTSVEAMNAVIDTHRDRTLSRPVTIDVLRRCGVTESLAPRTLKSLKLLDLVDEAGNPTPTFDKFKQVPTEQYQEVLADWLRDVYKPVFDFVDPNSDVQRIIDQFRSYEPSGQRNRMVTLFLGLCVKAGLLDKEPPMPRRASDGAPSRSGGTNGPAETTRSEHSTPKPPPSTPPREASRNSADGHTYNVSLQSGGTVALSVAVDPFALDERDRSFVFELVDKIKAYPLQQGGSP